jgi:hypothetical protein
MISLTSLTIGVPHQIFAHMECMIVLLMILPLWLVLAYYLIASGASHVQFGNGFRVSHNIILAMEQAFVAQKVDKD